MGPNLDISNKHVVVTWYNDNLQVDGKQQTVISRVTTSQTLKGLIQTTLFKVLYKNSICTGVRFIHFWLILWPSFTPNPCETHLLADKKIILSKMEKRTSRRF